MFILILLAQAVFSWSKEVRVVSLPTHEISYCGKTLSWRAILPHLTSKETECMDAEGPLGSSELFTTMANEKSELDRNFLVDSLKKSRSACFENSEWLIPPKLTFKSQINLTDAVFSEWLQHQLQSEMTGRQIEVTRVQIPRIECAKVNQVKWGSFRIEGKNTFRFLLMVDEKNYGITGEFRVFQNIPVVLRNYSPNEKIEIQDLEVQRREITFSPGYVVKAEDLAGRILKYPVAQGSPVQIQHLKPDVTVEKGQIIQIQYHGDNFVVTSSAIAEQSGSVGDLVKIKNIESHKTLSGIVLGKGLVEVQ